MRYYAYGAAMAGMVAVAATAVSWAQTTTSGNTQAGAATATAPTSPGSTAAPSASAATSPAASNQPAATSASKPQELASSPTCPPARVHRHVAYHRRVVHSTVRSESSMASYGGYSSVGSYGAEYAVAAVPPPPPVYYAPPPVPVWYAPGPRVWFGGPWHHWWHRWR